MSLQTTVFILFFNDSLNARISLDACCGGQSSVWLQNLRAVLAGALRIL